MSNLVKKTKVYIVANNHIDREWTYDAQLTRMLTAQFFEDLIETFEKIPDFQFVLDSQTVPLDDYLEIHPEKKEVLKKYVEEKRLWIGPWYTAPDSFYLSGESIVRNLYVGHEVAAAFGNVSKFGYTPFGWGQISQLPQIYAGFGIDSVFFYRGADTIKSTYYKWVGADGTKANCIKYHRTNFFDTVFRPMTKKREPVPWDRELDYAGNEVPFMFGSDDFKYEHGFVADGKYHIAKEKIAGAIEGFVEKHASHFPGGLVLGMNGMDTCFPSLKGLLAINQVKNSGNGDRTYELAYSSLDRFSSDLKETVARAGAKLEENAGEMRHFLPGFGGPNKSEAKSTHFYLAATRPRQKSKNARAENLLARYAEPFSTVGHLLGKSYPQAFLTTAWKHLLKCHPHDTIAGCGVDQIEIDMLNRLDQSINISKAVLNMSLQHIVTHIDNSQIKDDELALVVFNPSPFVRKEVVTSWLHLPEKLSIHEFEIVEKQSGQPVAFEVVERGETTDRIFRDLTDTTLYVYGELVRINLQVDVEGIGYKTFIVRKAASKPAAASKAAAADPCMENEHLRVTINEDGTFNLLEKETGKSYANLHYFTDTGDNGDPWVRFVPDRNRLHSSRGTKAVIRKMESSDLVSRCEIDYQMMIPKGLEKRNYIMEGYFDDAESSRELVPLKIKSVLTLSKGAKSLDIQTEIDNRSTDHLVQVVFPTGLKTDKVYAESGFDVVERTIVRNEKNADPSLVNGEDPFIRFVDMTEADKGLAILSDSVKGYEALGDEEGSLALNLIRAYTSQIVTIYGRKERRPDQGLTQAQGIHKFHYAVYPHAGTWENGCLQQAEQVNYPLVPVQTHRTFGKLPSELSFLKIGSPKVVVSALKKAGREDAAILRVYNPSQETVETEIELMREIEGAEVVNLNEEPLNTEKPVSFKGRKLEVSIDPKKIVTYKLTL